MQRFFAKINKQEFLKVLQQLKHWSNQAPKHAIISSLSLILAVSIAFREYQSYTPVPVEYEIEFDDTQSTLTDEQEATLTKQQAEAQVPVNFTSGEKFLIVGRGDTLAGMLTSTGASQKDAQLAVDAIKKVFNVKQLKLGQGIKIKASRDDLSNNIIIENISWKASPEQEIIVTQQNGKFTAKKNNIILKKCIEGVVGKINSNLHMAAVKQGAPSNLVKTAIRHLSFDVNFQTDPKPGNPFALVYEVYRDPEGKVVKYGNLLYAAMLVKGKLKQVYRFEGANGVNYFNQSGDCVVKSFMSTPLEVKRLSISSGYGLRMHPVKGYTAQHKGVDYRAPAGTPVLAAAGGVVTKAQYWSGFGLYVSIKHGDYTTEYAHLRRIAKGITPGTKVSQGQRIGEVGCTGTATGNHLHYGVIYKGRHINPATVKSTSSGKLSGKELGKFQLVKKNIDSYVKLGASQTEFVMSPNMKNIVS